MKKDFSFCVIFIVVLISFIFLNEINVRAEEGNIVKSNTININRKEVDSKKAALKKKYLNYSDDRLESIIIQEYFNNNLEGSTFIFSDSIFKIGNINLDKNNITITCSNGAKINGIISANYKSGIKISNCVGKFNLNMFSCENVTFENCTVNEGYDNNIHTFKFQNCKDVTVYNNKIYNVFNNGEPRIFFIDNSNRVIVNSNTIKNSYLSRKNGEQHCVGINISSSKNCHVTNNYLENIPDQGIMVDVNIGVSVKLLAYFLILEIVVKYPSKAVFNKLY